MEIPANIQQYINDHSRPLDSSECRPLILTGENVYLIESGSVNIFCTSVDDDNFMGNRTYVSSCSAGELLFPSVPFCYKNENVCLIADALTGSKILRLENPWLDELSGKVVSNWLLDMLEQWIDKLSAWFPRSNVPIHCKVISDNDLKAKNGTFEFEAGEDFRPERGLLWITVKEGFCAICGNEENVLLTEGNIFPMSRHIWSSALDKTIVSVEKSSDMIHDNNFKNYYTKFYENFFRSFLLSNSYRNKAALDKRSLLAELENKALDTSLKELSALNERKTYRKNVCVSPEALANPCFAVLEVLGEIIGADFKFPGNIKANIPPRNLLLTVLEQNSVYYRRVALDGAWRRGESTCMVAFRQKDDSPIGLIYNRGRGYLIYEPENNICRELTEKDTSEFHRAGYSLYSQLPSKALDIKDILPFALRHLRPEMQRAFVIGLAGGIVALLQPYVTGVIFNTVIPDADIFQLCQVGVILITAAITTTLFSMGRSFALLRVKTISNYNLQAAIVGRLLRLPLTLFKRYSTGDLAQRVMGVETIREVLADNVTNALFSLIMATPNLVLMCYYSWKLTLSGMAFLSVFFIVLAAVGYLNCDNQRNQMRLDGEISGFVFQILTGINKIRNSISENRVFIKWASRFTEETSWQIKSMRNSNFLMMFNCVYPALITGVFFYLIGGLWKGSLNIGNYLAFNSAFSSFMATVVGFAGILPALISMIPLYQRLQPVLEACPESDDSLKSPENIDGRVELSHISYRYNPDAPLALRDVNIKAESGEFIAIVGPSGAGKSTIIRLLLGFEEPESGAVFYSEMDINSINKRELRKLIGSVLQSDGLINGSIYENIAGASELPMENAWLAAEMAGCVNDIREMPMGMHTVVGNGTISGGQQQRLLIARALAKNPRIIIFDEATSAVDNETQAHIAESLTRQNATRIVVAHRLSTIKDADRIYVLEKGQLVQVGTFDELMNEPGIFSRLAKRQMV